MDWTALPPVAALRAFAAFAQTGGVQQAGDALNVSHAAISQQLRALESHLGVTLLNRSGRALQLTPDGELLAQAAVAGFRDMAQAVQDITGAETARPLCITTTNSFAANWLMPRLPEYRAAYPGDDIVIEARAELADPEPGGVDLALRYGDGTWPGLDAEKLVSSSVVGVATPEIYDAAQKDLRAVTWLQELGSHEGTNWLQTQGLSPKGGMISLPGNIALDAARAGQGIAITSRIAVEADLAAGRLRCVFEEGQGQGYFIVTRPGVQRPPLKSFVKWLRRVVASSAPAG